MSPIDPDEWHGPELDAALDVAATTLPHELGVCETALGSRNTVLIDAQLEDLTNEQSIAEAKALLMKQGAPFDNEAAMYLNLRGILGGTLSLGISLGIVLATQVPKGSLVGDDGAPRD